MKGSTASLFCWPALFQCPSATTFQTMVAGYRGVPTVSVDSKKLEHECRMIYAGLSFIGLGRRDDCVPTFWLLLCFDVALHPDSRSWGHLQAEACIQPPPKCTEISLVRSASLGCALASMEPEKGPLIDSCPLKKALCQVACSSSGVQPVTFTRVYPDPTRTHNAGPKTCKQTPQGLFLHVIGSHHIHTHTILLRRRG